MGPVSSETLKNRLNAESAGQGRIFIGNQSKQKYGRIVGVKLVRTLTTSSFHFSYIAS